MNDRKVRLEQSWYLRWSVHAEHPDGVGIILFLRLAYMVGSADILIALVSIVAANAMSVLTNFSVFGIATNLRVKGRGYCYLISRTLGSELGTITLEVPQHKSGGECILRIAAAQVALSSRGSSAPT